ncbi:hypothetical protein HYT56_02460 [Candidatus Woesearchaeota archaeon]|nr:hypothetical protein [Candidatus Woesearchaeota archaeon]
MNNRYKLLNCRCAKGAMSKIPKDDRESFSDFEDYNPEMWKTRDRKFKEKPADTISHRFKGLDIDKERRKNYFRVARDLDEFFYAYPILGDDYSNHVDGLGLRLRAGENGDVTTEVLIYDKGNSYYVNGPVYERVKNKLEDVLRRRFPNIISRNEGGK